MFLFYNALLYKINHSGNQDPNPVSIGTQLHQLLIVY